MQSVPITTKVVCSNPAHGKVNRVVFFHLQLMGQCWDELPEVRPSFKRVTKKLKGIFPIKGKLNDNLVAMVCFSELSFITSYLRLI
jgi:hypothetical protein